MQQQCFMKLFLITYKDLKMEFAKQRYIIKPGAIHVAQSHNKTVTFQ